MKQLWGILGLILVCLTMGHNQTSTNPPLQVMTFNIRFPNPDDGFHYWPNRRDLVASMIRFNEADLVGLQEAFRSQLDDLAARLPDYEWFGVCRTSGTTTPNPDNEFSAILYRKDRFEKRQGGTFWLSETPDAAGQKGWDANLPRIVTWAEFRDKASGKTFFHFNTHFDHVGQVARRESAKLILAKIKAIAGNAPVVCTGDFNARPSDEPIQVITDPKNPDALKDGYRITKMPHHGPTGTSTNGFLFPGVPDARIDYIFVKNRVSVLKHAILSDSWSGLLPSDHLPVLARISIE